MNPHIAQPAQADHADRSAFAHELMAGLRQHPRQVSPKWLYDQRGSQLFDQICELPEYYPTRTELALLTRHAHEMAECIGPQADLIEFGAGATRKVRLLLNALPDALRFTPIDISGEHLREASLDLSQAYPSLLVTPLVADFTQDLLLPKPLGRRIGFFPGSSIGNFEPSAAIGLLQRMARWLQGGGLLIGVDLVKDPAVLHAAYNDAQGITAAFNLNLLVRANTELHADFDVSGFAHSAFYNPPCKRIEMHLVSRCDQTVHLCGETLRFAEGDSIHTENSYKYTVQGFQQLARQAGLLPQAVWLDEHHTFSIHWLTCPELP